MNARLELGAALARGFTTVRDVAGGDIGLSRAIAAGMLASPRYFFTGPAPVKQAATGIRARSTLDICFGHGHMCEVVDGVDPSGSGSVSVCAPARMRLR